LILQEIKEKLKEVDPLVFYGMADDTDENNNPITEWNYTVYMRKTLSSSQNKTGFSDRFVVAIVRENFIPEGLDIEIIEKMDEIGMRLASPDSQYNYTKNPNTNTVVEILTMEFVKARKRAV
jgi:hypothetical protein